MEDYSKPLRVRHSRMLLTWFGGAHHRRVRDREPQKKYSGVTALKQLWLPSSDSPQLAAG